MTAVDDIGRITLVDITKSYGIGDTNTPVLAAASLKLEKRTVSAVVGPSGSGKSTMLNLIGGLDRPQSGQITVFGAPVTDFTADQAVRWRRDHIGYVFQDAGLMELLTVTENVQLPMLHSRLPSATRRKRASSLLEMVGLDQFRDRFPTTLSRGQSQRVALARAMAGTPELLLCDEPTGNLDRTNADSLLALLRTAVDEFGVTVILATHDLNALEIADAVITINEGSVHLEARTIQ